MALTNINNVKYRPDGTLVALGYNGNVWLLRDINGDGVEDKAELFGENTIGLRSAIGMDLTPPGYKHGDGLFVVGKTKCLLIVDTDKDGKADKVIDVAGGWKESFHAVDGLGVAFDKTDGSIYYGRGTYNFADPFLKDKEGKPHYSLTDEASAIIRVSPDFKTREVVATGIRFPVGLAFNRRGDLFCTDQEGATWVPNGNPLDELLHIPKGRHYAFLPRHPTHLPDAIDEPSTFDYGPQHQSTRGLGFNDPVKEGGADVRAEGVGRRRARDRRVLRRVVPHAVGEVGGRVRRPHAALRLPQHAHDRPVRVAGRGDRRGVPQRGAGLGERADRQGEAVQDQLHGHVRPLDFR